MSNMVRTDRQPRQRLDPDARRTAILAAAVEAFARDPYSDVKISAVAAGAGASDALVYRYFTGKEQLYAEIVRLAIEDLVAEQKAALAALDEGVPVRDRVRVATIAYLNHIAHHPGAGALPLERPGGEPEAAAAIRRQARHADVERLRTLLAASGQVRHEYALWGYFGFLEAAGRHWAGRGCPEDERWPLVDAALGALEGALGDWSA
jgi:AcrR family transcriptional regulator